MLRGHLSMHRGFLKLDVLADIERRAWYVCRTVDGVPMAAAYPRCIVPGGWYSNARAAAGDCAAPFDQPFHLLACVSLCTATFCNTEDAGLPLLSGFDVLWPHLLLSTATMPAGVCLAAQPAWVASCTGCAGIEACCAQHADHVNPKDMKCQMATPLLM